MDDLSRRRFLTVIPAAALVPSTFGRGQRSEAPAEFPSQDAEVVREMVGASHANLARVKELVSARPALARAAWDWGYGDWETALGAASHVGSKEIASVLLAAGAHPTIFSAAMLGQLEIVKAFIAASPGIQGTRGPHGITLMDHARAGDASEVVRYLASVGGAEPHYPNAPLLEGDPAALFGTYRFGTGPVDLFVVSTNARGMLVMKREGEPERTLFHHGRRTFNPAGAEEVRIRFEPDSGRAATVVVADGPLQVRAVR